MDELNSCIEPLSTKLINYLAKNNKLFCKEELDTLPDNIKNEIEKKSNDIFIHKAFTDLVHNKGIILRFYYINPSQCDIIYLMYKIRDDPDYIVNTGYTKYSFTLNINYDTGDDALYTLSIIDNATGEEGIYETMVGRFD